MPCKRPVCKGDRSLSYELSQRSVLSFAFRIYCKACNYTYIRSKPDIHCHEYDVDDHGEPLSNDDEMECNIKEVYVDNYDDKGKDNAEENSDDDEVDDSDDDNDADNNDSDDDHDVEDENNSNDVITDSSINICQQINKSSKVKKK